MNELVSIIVPIYNCSDYIKSCVECICNQSYFNIEVILVDDGSIDDSYKICKQIARTDDRIKVYHKNNGGVSSARNYGIKIARGKYISFVDSDDLLDERFIEVLVNGYSDDDVSLSVVGIQAIEIFKKSSVIVDKNYEYFYKTDAFREIFDNKNFFGFPVNKLYLKSIVDKMGNTPFNEKIYMCEDTLFNAQYLRMCNRISFNSSKLYFYYQRMNSATKALVFNKKKLTVFDSLNQIEKIYLKECPNNLVYLYKFYLYNYYLIKALIYNTKTRYKLFIKSCLKKYFVILFSTRVKLREKIKISIRYFLPRLNNYLYFKKIYFKERKKSA